MSNYDVRRKVLSPRVQPLDSALDMVGTYLAHALSMNGSIGALVRVR